MTNDELILAEEWCSHSSIQVSFVQTMHEMGLLQLVSIEQKPYIPHDELQRLEQLTRLHVDLQVNIEGVDVICNLLDKIIALKNETLTLKKRLQLYE